jgi:hypothetical protein
MSIGVGNSMSFTKETVRPIALAVPGGEFDGFTEHRAFYLILWVMVVVAALQCGANEVGSSYGLASFTW